MPRKGLELTKLQDMRRLRRNADARARRKFHKILDEHIRRRNAITANWEDEHKPIWKKIVSKQGDKWDIRLEIVGPAARGADVTVWRMLNDGTDVRHAIMSKDFQPKTRRGLLGEGPGEGRSLVVRPEVEMPGIDGRHWDEDINAELQPKMQLALLEAWLETLGLD